MFQLVSKDPDNLESVLDLNPINATASKIITSSMRNAPAIQPAPVSRTISAEITAVGTMNPLPNKQSKKCGATVAVGHRSRETYNVGGRRVPRSTDQARDSSR